MVSSCFWASSLASPSSVRAEGGRGVVARPLSARKDSIAQFSTAGRTDLVDKETAELQVLEGYLPARLSAEEITAQVKALVAELGATGPGDMGKVMAAAKARFGSQAEMALVSAAVKQALAK